MQDELKRRSTLSRLEGVAEAVWMQVSAFLRTKQAKTMLKVWPASSRFFSLSPSNTASLASPGSSPRAKRRAFPVSDVIDIVVKSSKTPISGRKSHSGPRVAPMLKRRAHPPQRKHTTLSSSSRNYARRSSSCARSHVKNGSRCHPRRIRSMLRLARRLALRDRRARARSSFVVVAGACAR